MLEKGVGLPVFLLAMSLLLAVMPLMANPAIAQNTALCDEVIDTNTRISRAQLLGFLSIPIGSDRSVVEAQLGKGYCLLDFTDIAYPLGSDPSTWLTVRYSRNRYISYGFKYRVCGMGGFC